MSEETRRDGAGRRASAPPGEVPEERPREGGGAHAADTGGVLPGSRDDSDEGWGERPEGDDDERFLREVPPHW